MMDVDFGDSYKPVNFTQIDLDWEFFYSYTSAKMKDTRGKIIE